MTEIYTPTRLPTEEPEKENLYKVEHDEDKMLERNPKKGRSNITQCTYSQKTKMPLSKQFINLLLQLESLLILKREQSKDQYNKK